MTTPQEPDGEYLADTVTATTSLDARGDTAIAAIQCVDETLGAMWSAGWRRGRRRYVVEEIDIGLWEASIEVTKEVPR